MPLQHRALAEPLVQEVSRSTSRRGALLGFLLIALALALLPSCRAPFGFSVAEELFASSVRPVASSSSSSSSSSRGIRHSDSRSRNPAMRQRTSSIANGMRTLPTSRERIQVFGNAFGTRLPDVGSDSRDTRDLASRLAQNLATVGVAMQRAAAGILMMAYLTAATPTFADSTPSAVRASNQETAASLAKAQDAAKDVVESPQVKFAFKKAEQVASTAGGLAVDAAQFAGRKILDRDTRKAFFEGLANVADGASTLALDVAGSSQFQAAVGAVEGKALEVVAPITDPEVRKAVLLELQAEKVIDAAVVAKAVATVEGVQNSPQFQFAAEKAQKAADMVGEMAAEKAQEVGSKIQDRSSRRAFFNRAAELSEQAATVLLETEEEVRTSAEVQSAASAVASGIQAAPSVITDPSARKAAIVKLRDTISDSKTQDSVAIGAVKLGGAVATKAVQLGGKVVEVPEINSAIQGAQAEVEKEKQALTIAAQQKAIEAAQVAQRSANDAAFKAAVLATEKAQDAATAISTGAVEVVQGTGAALTNPNNIKSALDGLRSSPEAIKEAAQTVKDPVARKAALQGVQSAAVGTAQQAVGTIEGAAAQTAKSAIETLEEQAPFVPQALQKVEETATKAGELLKASTPKKTRTTKVVAVSSPQAAGDTASPTADVPALRSSTAGL